MTSFIFNDNTQEMDARGITFAEPGEAFSLGQTLKNIITAPVDPILHPEPYRQIFDTAERSERLTGNIVSGHQALEEAYDNRIKAVKDATGVELENPQRNGYAIDARKQIRDEVRAGGMAPIDEQGGIPAYQRKIFDAKLAELHAKYPDLPSTDIDEEARKLAAGAAQAAAAPYPEGVNPITAAATTFAGGLYGMRRDPLFVGSLFAGPASAAGKTALTRIATSAFSQGLYNMGLSAIEQPVVQQWRHEVGLRSGVEPALEDVGMAFLFGVIPGAGFQGAREAGPALKRLLSGAPREGDIAKAESVLGKAPELHTAESAIADDQAVLRDPAPKGVPPDLHDELTGAALRKADIPDAPGPDAVAAVKDLSVEVKAGAESPDQHLDPIIARVRGLGSPMDIAQRWARDPEDAVQAINDLIPQIKTAEREIARRHGIKSKDVSDLEDAPLSKKESDFLFYGSDHTDTEFWKDMRAQLQPVDSLDEAAREIGYEFRRLPADTNKLSTGDELVMARLQVLFSEVGRLGGDLKTVLRDAAEKYGARFSDPDDAIFMVQNAAERMREMMRPPDIQPKVITSRNAPTDELRARIEAAQPKSEQEAMAAADEALDDFGRRDMQAVVRERLAERAEPIPGAKLPRGDVMGKIPFAGEDGKARMLTPKEAAALGEAETNLANLIRSCK